MNAPRRDLGAPGTPEADWRASGVLEAVAVAEAAAVAPGGRAVVVAPHPDDEVLGVGGLLATWAGLGVPVLVVAVTDGEGSHPGSPTLDPDELAVRRRTERHDALGRLGLGAATVVRLELPDGGVADAEDALTERLAGILAPGDLCLSPRPDDGHPDHDAVARACRRAGSTARGVRHAHFAVWWWHWARPDTDSGDWGNATRVVLTERALAAKRAAIGDFVTQVSALSDDPHDAVVLPPAVLDRLRREFEVLWWT